MHVHYMLLLVQKCFKTHQRRQIQTEVSTISIAKFEPEDIKKRRQNDRKEDGAMEEIKIQKDRYERLLSAPVKA